MWSAQSVFTIVKKKKTQKNKATWLLLTRRVDAERTSVCLKEVAVMCKASSRFTGQSKDYSALIIWCSNNSNTRAASLFLLWVADSVSACILGLLQTQVKNVCANAAHTKCRLRRLGTLCRVGHKGATLNEGNSLSCSRLSRWRHGL